jgi:hypothetical protein
MQTIRTRYHSASNVKGSRFSAQCEAGRIYVPYNHALNLDENHMEAARQLIAPWSDGLHYQGHLAIQSDSGRLVAFCGAISRNDGQLENLANARNWLASNTVSTNLKLRR